MEYSQLIDEYIKKGFTPTQAAETAKIDIQSVNLRLTHNLLIR